MRGHHATQREGQLAALPFKHRAAARQYLREFGQHHPREFGRIDGVGLIARQRQPHERHVAAAGVQFNVAVPPPARVVPVDPVAHHTHFAGGKLLQEHVFVQDARREVGHARPVRGRRGVP